MDHFSAQKLCVSDAPPQTKHWATDAGDQAFKSNAKHPEGTCWELVDRLEISDEALKSVHGLNQQPVFGTLVWAGPLPSTNRLGQHPPRGRSAGSKRTRRNHALRLTPPGTDRPLQRRLKP
jgi:hypothetical protein